MIVKTASVNPFRKIFIILEMIKFEHTIFAMPFALISMLVAAHGLPALRIFGWIIVAMVGARSAAMAFNRIVDAKLDAANPRTASRAIPKGLITVSAAWMFTVVAAGLLVLAAYKLNRLALMLSPLALIAVMGYSYSKRFTSLSHLWLGLCLGIAPVGAWIAVTGKMGFPSMVLSAAVVFWTAGFDVIYSLQDLEFDRKTGLFSLPARIGPEAALVASRVFHALMVGLIIWFGLLCRMGAMYYLGAVLVGVFLIYEQSLISARDTSRVNAAFFTMNGCVSIGLLIFVMVDLFL